MNASSRGERRAAHGARPEPVWAAIEADGLVQRFGRPVPDSIALLERIARLPGASGRLDVSLVRFGPGDAAGLIADLEALDIAALCRRLGFRFRAAATASDLAEAGGRTMLLAGREQSALEALDRGLPAYLVSDRRLRDHRQLPLAEVERVLAEALRIPVPRPMSDESRRGCMLAMAAGSPRDVRSLGGSLLRDDRRADWVTLGARLVIYTEVEEVVADLTAAGAEIVARGVDLRTIGVRRLVPAAGPVADALLTAAGWQLCRSEPDTIAWARIRRARLFADDAASVAPARALPSLAGARQAGRSIAAGWGADPGSAAKIPALVPQARSFDDSPALSFALPFGDDASESIIAIVRETAPGADDESGAGAAAQFALALRRRGVRAALLVRLGSANAFERLETLLWEQEESRLQAIVAVRSGADLTDVAPPAARSGPGRPLTLVVDLPGDRTSHAVDAAAEKIRAVLAENSTPSGRR